MPDAKILDAEPSPVTAEADAGPLGGGHLSPAREKRRNIVYLRSLLVIALGGILIEAGGVTVGSIGLTLLILHAAINLCLLSVPIRLIRFVRFELIVGAADVVVVAAAIQLAGTGGVLPISCLMMVLVVALGNNRLHTLAGGAAVCALHTWMILGDSAATLRQIAPHVVFLGTIGLYFGYLASGIHIFRRRADAERFEQAELQILLDILDTISSSLDLEDVTRTIVAKITQIVPATRCSVLFVNEKESRCYVIASHDDPNINMLEIDLNKYPEVRQAINSRNPVLIRNVEIDPLMRGVRNILSELDLQSIVVIPMVFGDDVLGTMCLKASRVRHEFTPREINFCTAVSRACANALKNALLHRQVHDESCRHRRLSDKLSRIFDHSPELILTTDTSGRITEFNAGAERLLDYSKRQVRNRSCDMLFADDSGFELVERIHSTGPISNLLCQLRKADGRNVDVEMNLSLLKDETGRVTGTVWLGRDVTELKETHTQLLQARKLSTIGEVISGVAHELNNPLSGVLGFSELLLMREVDSQVRQEVELIHDSALRCQKIVKNLLSFARENKPERKNQSVNEIVEKTLDMKKYQLHVNSIEVERDLDRTLPRMLVDFHQLQQVLLNLINNAQHAMMRSRKVQPSKLRVKTSLCENGVQIELSDNGEGMEEATLERIFDPFFTTKETGQGTGLGLSVSYGIINEHGGRIWARSTKGEGTAFTIELPVRNEDRIVPVETQDILVEEPAVRPGSRILVVDDEPVILQLFVNLFEGRGYKVDTAVNGCDAVEQIALKGYDLIVTDVRMPEMNGIELYPKILARRPELEGRVIFITGDLGDTETARFLADTDVQTLTKPLEIREVVRVVDAALAQPSSARSC